MNKKNIINLSLISMIFIGLIIYMLKVDGLSNMIDIIKKVDLKWMIAGIICMIIYWFFEALCLHVVTNKIYKKNKFKESLRISMIGQLFNCITPFSSGGQPIQAYEMTKSGKSITNSATILLIKFIIYQAVLVIYTLVIIIFEYSYFKGLLSNFIDLAIIGFLVNFVVIVFLIIMGINKNLVFKVISFSFKVLEKLNLMNKKDEKLDKLKLKITRFHNQFEIIKKEKKMVFKLIIYTLIQLTVYFAVTYMVYRSFSQGSGNFIHIISAQAFLFMITAFIPIPGAGIAAEGGFYIIFNTFFENGTINMAILFWRMYTFYLPIIVGAMFLLVHKDKKNKNMEQNKIEMVEEISNE